MKQNKETKAKLIQSARSEFLEKGYMKASLRNICKNAGVTTGAMYFFFNDKDDLFKEVTKVIVDKIYSVMESHYRDELDMVGNGMAITPQLADTGDDFAVARELIHQMYVYRDDVLLVLTKSQGSSMENVVDKFIDTSEKHYRVMANRMQLENPGVAIEDRFIHWLAHEQVDAFIYMITHIEEEQDGIRYMNQMITYMMAGWFGLFGIK